MGVFPHSCPGCTDTAVDSTTQFVLPGPPTAKVFGKVTAKLGWQSLAVSCVIIPASLDCSGEIKSWLVTAKVTRRETFLLRPWKGL